MWITLRYFGGILGRMTTGINIWLTNQSGSTSTTKWKHLATKFKDTESRTRTFTMNLLTVTTPYFFSISTKEEETCIVGSWGEMADDRYRGDLEPDYLLKICYESLCSGAKDITSISYKATESQAEWKEQDFATGAQAGFGRIADSFVCDNGPESYFWQSEERRRFH